MIDYNKLISKMENTVFSINEYLKSLKKSQFTIKDYYSKVYNYRVNEKIFPESIVFKQLILEEVKRIYGSEKEKLVKLYLETHFVADTATHFSLPRTYDNMNGIDYDSNLTWNSYLISVAMSKHYNQKIHFGIYTTEININTVNSPGVFEISPYNSAKLFNKKAQRDCVRYSTISNKTMQKCIDILYDNEINEVLNQCDSLNTDKIYIKKELKNIVKQGVCNINHEKFTSLDQIDFERIVTNYERTMDLIKQMPKLIRNNDLCYEKIVLLHKYLFDELIDSQKSGIEQITISTDVLVHYLIYQLEDENSLLFRIFSDSILLKRFVEELSDIRSGWKKVKQDESILMTSPFLKRVISTNNTRLEPYYFQMYTHTPAVLINQLKKGEIFPTVIMKFVIYLTAGFLPVGGMLQSYYAKELQVKLCEFLDDIDKTKSEEIRNIPVEISLHCMAFFAKDNMSLYNYYDLINMKEFIPNILRDIPNANLETSYYNALPTLYNFFVYYILPSDHQNYKNTVCNINKNRYFNSLKLRGID